MVKWTVKVQRCIDFFLEWYGTENDVSKSERHKQKIEDALRQETG
jgi:hypothetical protein